MDHNITLQKIFEVIKQFPEDSLYEVWNFIEFIRFKNQKKSSSRLVKLGGILAGYKIDITEKDIAEARGEMWHNLGELRE